MKPGPKPTITGAALAVCTRRYLEGAHLAELARAYKVHPHTITRVMAQAGSRRGRMKRGITPRVQALAVKAHALWTKGRTLKQIGGALGMSFGRAGQLVRWESGRVRARLDQEEAARAVTATV